MPPLEMKCEAPYEETPRSRTRTRDTRYDIRDLGNIHNVFTDRPVCRIVFAAAAAQIYYPTKHACTNQDPVINTYKALRKTHYRNTLATSGMPFMAAVI